MPVARDGVRAGDAFSGYRASPEFKRLAASTKAGYDIYLDLLAVDCANERVADIDTAWLYQARDELADKPRAADSMLAVMSILLNFAIKRGLATDNPALHVERVRGGKSYEAWSDIAIERFRAGSGPALPAPMA